MPGTSTCVLALLVLVVSRVSNITSESVAQKQDDTIRPYQDETRFWGRAMCGAGRRRWFRLYQSPDNDSFSRRLLDDFFGSLVTYVQTECVTSVTINDDKSPRTYEPSSYRAFRAEPPPPMSVDDLDEVEMPLFPRKDVDIIVAMVRDSVRLSIDDNFWDDWNSGRRAMLLMISNETTEDENDATTALLEKLWFERRILDVFFALPLSAESVRRRRVRFYDPFFVNETLSKRGRILETGLGGISSLDRLDDLNGYTLNVGMFESYPSAIRYDDESSHGSPFAAGSRGFVGIDGLAMATIANRMNFTPKIVPPSDGIEFGYACDNGTFVGTLGDAAYHRIDIGFNALYYKIYSPPSSNERKAIVLTVPIEFDRLCIVVPRSRKIPRWLRTFYSFDPAIWVCIGLTQILVSIVWHLVRQFRLGVDANYHSTLLVTFLLFVGTPLKLRLSEPERILLSALILLGVTVMGTFTGTLYRSFANEMRYRDIESLSELDASGIPVATASPSLRDVFGLDDEDDDVLSLRNKLTVLPYDGVPTIAKTAHRRNVASLSREHTFRVSAHRYADENGNSLLHLVRDCPRSYYLSYVVPSDSVYIDRFDALLTRLREAGLPDLWNSVAPSSPSSTVADRTVLEGAAFDVSDTQTCFLLLSIGHFVAFFVLLGELACSRRCTVVVQMKH